MSTAEIQPTQDPVADQQLTKSADNDPITKPEQKEIAPEEEEMMIANAISGDKIKELLSAEGPTVKSVLLKTDGSIEEVLYDSTPSKNHVTEILGAPPSIIGQYPDLDVIVVGPRCEPTETFAVNTHKLRYPFNNDTFHGDIFLYRFDQNCEMQDFTVEEYKAFAAKSAQDIGKVFKPQINDEQDTFDEEEEDQYENYDETEAAQATQDFMREVVMNKVKAEFPAKFGREPTEEELETYISSIMQAAGGLFGVEVDEDEDDANDDDYDPEEEEEDEEHEVPNDEQLQQDKSDIISAQNEEEAPLKEMNEEDEEALINSEAFEKELLSAMECVQHMAKVDRERILSLAKEEYAKDIGHEPSDEMMAAALQMFATEDHEAQNATDECEKEVKEEANEAQEEEEEICPKLFETEMQEALNVIRNLGKEHQKELVGKICTTFTELNGSEPTKEQLSDIFGRIKGELAEEAKDEFLEIADLEDDAANDPDYKPNSEDLQQVEEDKKIEVLQELMQDEVVDNVVHEKAVKVLVTPVKRRASGSRMCVYLDEPDTEKTLQMAESRFEQINHRAPSEEDAQRLKEFCDTGMLFESVVKADVEFDDDEDDEDYDPNKDTFDYSQDIADDKVFEKEQAELDENEDTSNMIDID